MITAGALFALAGCGGNDGPGAAPAAPAAAPTPAAAPVAVNTLPTGVTQHSVTNYSATSVGAGTSAATQDLLTAGLGTAGLQAAAPVYADSANPTAIELRRNSIHANYRGLADITTTGGYGTLYGPNVALDGTATTNAGLIPGREYFASADDGSGSKRVVMAVQIPDSFNPADPCLVLGPSSGSRGVYGAIGTSAEWALKRGCAVALTDAGKGASYYNFADDTVNRLDGTRSTRAAAGALNHFAVAVSDVARAAYNALFPNRIAIKQAHSQQNPEKDWGSDTLVAGRYAFYALNDRFGTAANPTPFTPANTLVIAGSVSNGGAGVIRAAEADTTGLIDGVVAGEPVTEMPTSTGYGVLFAGAPVASQGRHLADYVTFANLYQPCAALAPSLSTSGEGSTLNIIGATPALAARATARCDALAARNLAAGATTELRAEDSLQRLRAYGWTPESDLLHSSQFGLGATATLAAMYPWSYGRFSALDDICATSFAATDAAGLVVAPAATGVGGNNIAISFATGNGTSNNAPANVVYNNSVGGARAWTVAVSPSTGVADFGFDNALCQRALVTGADAVTGTALSAATTPTAAQSAAVRAGMAETTVSGNLRGKPTLIVAGRSDALIPANHNSRAYAAYNRAVEGSGSKLRYVEVTNAQHFDAFLALPGYANRYVPLHLYFVRAMDAMYAHLKNGAALPASQVVRTTVRGGTAAAPNPLTATNVPNFSATPAAANEIGFGSTTVAVPN